MKITKEDYWKFFGEYYNVDLTFRPDGIDEVWAENIVDEWIDIYRKFLDEAENFLIRAGLDKVEIVEGHHPNVLRRFLIKFK